MGKASKAWNVAKLMAFVAILGFLYLLIRRIGVRKVWALFQQVPPKMIYLSGALHLAAFLLWTLRWQLLMQRKHRKPFHVLFPVYMAGVFGNIVTPGARVGGEPLRAFYMSRIYGGSKTSHLGTVLAAKAGNAVVFMGLVLFSVTFVTLFVPINIWLKVLLEGFVLLIVAAMVSGFLLREKIGVRSPLMGKLLGWIYNLPLLRVLRKRFHSYERFENYMIDKLDNVFAPVVRTVTTPKAMAKTLFTTLSSWLTFFLAHYLFFVSLGADIDYLGVVIIVCISTFLGEMAASPGGAGFMETIMIGLCAGFGVETSIAAAVTLLSRALFYIIGVGIGGVCFGALALMYGRRPTNSSETAPEHPE